MYMHIYLMHTFLAVRDVTERVHVTQARLRMSNKTPSFSYYTGTKHLWQKSLLGAVKEYNSQAFPCFTQNTYSEIFYIN